MSGWVAGAIVVSAAANVYSSRESSKAQQQAAQTGASAQERSTQLQVQELRRQYDQLRADLEPYRELGTQAAQAIQTGEQTPLTQYLVGQGTKAVNRAASAQGFLNTGQQKQELQRAGQGAALQGTLPYLQIGENAAAQTGTAGLQTGQGIAGAYGQQGQSAQNAALLAGGARASAYQNYGNIANNALNQYLLYRGFTQGGSPASYYGAGQTSGYGANVPGDAYAPAYGG